MKTSYLIPCIIAISLVTSCIKEEGEELTILRTVGDSTIVSDIKGYFYGEAYKDQCVDKYFKPIVTKNKIHAIDCYLDIKSTYYNLDIDKNKVVGYGYTWSDTDKEPVAGRDTFKILEFNEKDLGGDSIVFKGSINSLLHNHTYYVRSFVITENGDTAYNPHTITEKTVLPEDIWFERKKATLSPLENPITFQIKQQVYVYGGRNSSKCSNEMWTYNKEEDAWMQLATFDVPLFENTNRCNGAAFVATDIYKGVYQSKDTIVYICGGEDYDGNILKNVFIYNATQNKFPTSRQEFHPNQRAGVADLPQPLTGLVAFTVENTGGGDYSERYYVGFGYTKQDGSINPQFFEYQVREDAADGSGIVWNAKSGLPGISSSTRSGLANPIFIPINSDNKIGNSFYIGTGVSSINNKISNTIYRCSVDNTGEINVSQTITDSIPVRTNATGFMLDFTKKDADGYETDYSRLYIGTGQTTDGSLLNDFWAYDLVEGEWVRCADCGEICREGASSFVIERNDDMYATEFSENQRGYVIFGRGYNKNQDSGNGKLLNDVWEYLP